MFSSFAAKWRRRVVWFLRQLSQDRFIIRMFLIGLLLLVGIGLTGALQSQLNTVGGGHTGLAYKLITVIRGARLDPSADLGQFQSLPELDSTLRQYFLLDKKTGSLSLRDGLQSLSFAHNPLQSFPVQIIETSQDVEAPMKEDPKAISLYLHLLNCGEYLSIEQNAPEAVINDMRRLEERKAARHCAKGPSVIRHASTLSMVEKWLRQKSKEMALLDTQRDAYIQDAKTILSLRPDYTWHEDSPKPVGADVERLERTPVWQIFILSEKARPGLEVFRVGDDLNGLPQAPSQSLLLPLRQSRLSSSQQGFISLPKIADWAFVALLRLRYPVLILLGILLPVLALIIRRRDIVVRRCLEPYLLLLLGQFFSLFAAEALMGEGLMVWVGFIYTLLRILQLLGILGMANAASPHLRRLFDLRGRRWLRNLLLILLGLWGLNGLGLAWHIFSVLVRFEHISPA